MFNKSLKKSLLILVCSAVFISIDTQAAGSEGCSKENIENLVSTKTSKKQVDRPVNEVQKEDTGKANESTSMKMLKLLIPQPLR